MMKKTLLRRRAFLSAVVFVCLPRFSAADTAGPDPAKVSDPWQPLRVLVGSWEGDAQGEPGSGKSAREYRFTLNDRFIHVTSRTTYPPQDKNPKGEVHEDVGFISYDKTAKKLVMRQFHQTSIALRARRRNSRGDQSHRSRNAAATGTRAACIAGSRPPTRPIAIA